MSDLRDMDPQVLAEYVTEADGWTLWDATKMVEAGFPQEWIDTVARKYVSNLGDYKATIFDTRGGIVLETYGVHALQFLGAVARTLEADTTRVTATGRGFRARQLQEAIAPRLAELLA